MHACFTWKPYLLLQWCVVQTPPCSFHWQQQQIQFYQYIFCNIIYIVKLYIVYEYSIVHMLNNLINEYTIIHCSFTRGSLKGLSIECEFQGIVLSHSEWAITHVCTIVLSMWSSYDGTVVYMSVWDMGICTKGTSSLVLMNHLHAWCKWLSQLQQVLVIFADTLTDYTLQMPLPSVRSILLCHFLITVIKGMYGFDIHVLYVSVKWVDYFLPYPLTYM